MGGAGAGPAEDSPEEPVWLLWVTLALCPVSVSWFWRKDVIRPGSPGRHHGRDITGSSHLGWWGGALLVIFALAAGQAMGAMLFGVQLDEPEGSRRLIFTQVFGSAVAAAAGLWIMWLYRGMPGGARAGLDLRPRIGDVRRGLLVLIASWPILLAVMIGASIIAALVTGEPPPTVAHEALKLMQADPWSARTAALIVGAVALAPVSEEILFRGLLQSGILRLTGRVWPSVLFTSVVFAAIHVGAVKEAPHAMAPLFVLGVVLGLAYERTGRIWVPITIHALFNGANTAIALAG